MKFKGTVRLVSGCMTVLETAEKPKTVRCPICRRQTDPRDLRESVIKVVGSGKVIGKARSILAECCSTEYLLVDE